MTNNEYCLVHSSCFVTTTFHYVYVTSTPMGHYRFPESRKITGWHSKWWNPSYLNVNRIFFGINPSHKRGSGSIICTEEIALSNSRRRS
jgi:hypothetical protein